MQTPDKASDGGRRHSLGREALGRLWRRRTARFALGVIALYTVAALYGEGLHLYYRFTDRVAPYQQVNMQARYLPPSFLCRPFAADDAGGERGVAARAAAGWRRLLRHPLGTDNLGRDVFQRLVQGTRIAFHVGIVTSLIAIPIGVILGCLAGYFGGRLDAVIVWLYSTVAAMPGLLFILAISVLVGKGLPGIYAGIGFTTWVGVCRLVRGEVIRHKAQPYVQAARTLGFGRLRILFRHILPNVMHVVIVVFSLRFPAAVGTEIFISFLGIGVQDEPSWGLMIGNARLRLWQGVWWEMTFVTLAILLLVLSFNLLGDALRDAFDPRLRTGHNR
jgi:peptide/nickel transport system permease protein